MITKELSNRLANFSFVCAVLVVLIHCTPAPVPGSWTWWFCRTFGREGICNVAVPYFFLAAGFFLAGKMNETGWWKRETMKRVRSLLVPFYFWSVVYLGFNVALWYVKSHVFHQALACGILEAPLYTLFVLTGLHLFQDIGVFWFIRALFILVLLSPLIKWALAHVKGFLVGVAIAYLAFSWCFGVFGWDFYAFFDRYLSVRGLLYFSLGMFLRMKGSEMRISGKTAVWCGAAGFALLIAKNYLNLKGLYPASSVLEAVAVPFLMMLGLGVMPRGKWPAFLTGNAFAIFLIHNIFLSFVAMVLMALKVYDRAGLLIPIMYTRLIGTVFCAIVTAQLLRRFFPRFAALVFGGR